MPEEEKILQLSSPGTHIAMAFDDQQEQVLSSPAIQNLFLRISHHRCISAFVLLHNLYGQGKYAINIFLNVKYLHLFESQRDLHQIKMLGMQMYPGRSNVILEAYEDSLKSRYNCLLVDITGSVPPEHRLRTHVLEPDTYVYVPV